MGRFVLAIALLLALAVVAEGQYRRNVVTPQFLQLLADDANLTTDLRTIAKPRAHFPLADIGNALTPFCADGPYGCFSWKQFSNVDTLLAISPAAEIRGTVRVLERCDIGNCIFLPNASLWIRKASSEELANYSNARSSVGDGCVERSIGPYAALICGAQETVAGLPTYSAYWMGEPYLKALDALAISKMRSVAGLELNFVTGRSDIDEALMPFLEGTSI